MAGLRIPCVDGSSTHEEQGIVPSSGLATTLATPEMDEYGKAMAREDYYGQNVEPISSAAREAMRADPLLLTSSNREDTFMQEQLTVGSGNVGAGASSGYGNYDKKKFKTMEPPRVLPSVGAFTVQCARCMKWRLIPTKEQYEEIRQSVLEKPFFCSSAASWRPNASCDDPSDVSQDVSHLWAIDRPNIPLAPDGWERLLVIRAAGASKFADVYYVAPSGRRLRSMPEVERFLAEHPEYVNAGVKLSQFSFIIPKPLDKDYCRKKTVGPSSLGAKGTIILKKPYSNNNIKKSHFNKLRIKQKALKAVSTEQGSEKLVGRKKSLARILADGHSQRLPGAEHSDDFLASRQVLNVETALPFPDSVGGLSRDYTVANFRNDDQVSAFAMSQECNTMLNKADAAVQAVQNLVGNRNNHCETSSVTEKNTCTDLVLVHPKSGTIPSALQESPTSIGS